MDDAGFVTRFREYGQTRSDCPPDFFVHAALVCLAVSLGNSVSISGWGDDIYPNLWTVAIARSGMGKGVPLSLARRVLRRAGMGEQILDNSFSLEGLIEKLEQRPNGVFIQDEFAGFMAMLGREYMGNAMQWLTDIYNCPEEVTRQLRVKRSVIKLPTLSILGASSPAWFNAQFRMSALSGGFLARFVFAPANAPGEELPGDPGPPDVTLESELADHLRQAGELSGRCDMRRIRRRFEEWDRGMRRSVVEWPEELGGLRSRAGELCKKALILFHVSRDPYTTTLDDQDLDNATAYVEHTHEAARAYLTDEVPFDKEDESVKRLVAAVVRGGGRLPHYQALRNTHLGADGLKRAVQTALEARLLVKERVDGPGGGAVYALPSASTEENSSHNSSLSLRTLRMASHANGSHAPP